MNLEQTTQIINQSIIGLKLDPQACKGDNPGQWNLTIKDSTVWIDVFNFDSNPDRWYIQVMSPLLAVPDRNVPEIMNDILEINSKLYGCAICKKKNWFYVISLRETDGLDQSELDATIDRVGIYSSDYYSKLGFKYEGSWDKKPANNDSEAPK